MAARLGCLTGVSGRSAGIPERYEQRPVAVAGKTEYLAGEPHVGDARVAAADPQVGGRERDGHRRLPQVELGAVEFVVRNGTHYDDGRR